MEDRERIANSIDAILISYSTMLAGQIPEKFKESIELIKQRGANRILKDLQELGYCKPGELLSDEEGEIAVEKWVNEDWETRYIRLSRGHWEDIIHVIAQAQLDLREE